MKKAFFGPFLLLFFLMSASPALAARINLQDWAFNLDGTFSAYDQGTGGPMPGNFNDTAFDYTLGTGAISHTFSFTGTGSHAIIGFYDFEMDEKTNTFFNESGSAVGNAASGQSWEIDEPDRLYGNIYNHVTAGALDNTNSVAPGSEDDVSFSLGWNFSLTRMQNALVTFTISSIMPQTGFFLEHLDAESDNGNGHTLYFSSTLTIKGGHDPIPEPGTILLFGLGLLGISGTCRIKLKKS